MQIAGNPACLSPVWSHAANEHASGPTRSRGRPTFCKAAMSAFGSLVARPSFTMPPCSSTTQIAVSFRNTSNPAKYFMAAPSRCYGGATTDHVYHPDRSSRPQSSTKTEPGLIVLSNPTDTPVSGNALIPRAQTAPGALNNLSTLFDALTALMTLLSR